MHRTNEVERPKPHVRRMTVEVKASLHKSLALEAVRREVPRRELIELAIAAFLKKVPA